MYACVYLSLHPSLFALFASILDGSGVSGGETPTRGVQSRFWHWSKCRLCSSVAPRRPSHLLHGWHCYGQAVQILAQYIYMRARWECEWKGKRITETPEALLSIINRGGKDGINELCLLTSLALFTNSISEMSAPFQKKLSLEVCLFLLYIIDL